MLPRIPPHSFSVSGDLITVPPLALYGDTGYNVLFYVRVLIGSRCAQARSHLIKHGWDVGYAEIASRDKRRAAESGQENGSRREDGVFMQMKFERNRVC